MGAKLRRHADDTISLISVEALSLKCHSLQKFLNRVGDSSVYRTVC